MDKKLTDSEIVKALECCRDIDIKCETCQLWTVSECTKVLYQATLDLINRLQDENRKLKAKQGILLHTTVSAYSADETIKELQAKVERRDKLLKEVLKGKANIKAEAYKEFAERLKEKLWSPVETWLTSDVVTEEEIDNLLKELVGEDK